MGKAVAAGGAPKVQLEDMLLLLHRTYSTVSDSTIFSGRGVNLEGWAILRKIGPDECTVAQIARNLLISRRRVTMAVADLADRGLIEISQSGEGRRPVRSVAILPKGREILSHISSQLESLDHAGNERPFNRGRRAFRVVLRTLPHRKKPVALDANR
jgi:DNA-binding MarR family transcriptional regulator